MKLRNKNLSLIALSLTGVLSCGSNEEIFAMDDTLEKEKTIDVKFDPIKQEWPSESIKDQGGKEESDKKSDVRKTVEQEQGQIQEKAKNEDYWDANSLKFAGKTEDHPYLKRSGIRGEIFCDVDKNARIVSTNSPGVLTELVFRLHEKERSHLTLEITVHEDKISELDQQFSRSLVKKLNFHQNAFGDLTGSVSGKEIATVLDEIYARRGDVPGGHKESFGVTYKLSNLSHLVSDRIESILTSREFQPNIQMRDLYYLKVHPLADKLEQISGSSFLGSTIEIGKQDPKDLKDQFNSFPRDFPHDEDPHVSVSDEDEMMIMTTGKFTDFWKSGVLKGNKTDYFITMNAANPISENLKNDYPLSGIAVEGNKRIFSKIEKEEMEKLVNDPRFPELEGIVSVVFNDNVNYQGAKELLTINS
ncbi:MAG TPA: hypothetical protein PLY23_08615 [Alphaproteobacteria bacterium]|nr:hypothetical protein [Alphaproteobacteria bacterium]HQS94707.1 hypothetical protein [Alphaproteobacteria bacterium]